jgi:hypothetical protein
LVARPPRVALGDDFGALLDPSSGVLVALQLPQHLQRPELNPLPPSLPRAVYRRLLLLAHVEPAVHRRAVFLALIPDELGDLGWFVR